MWKKIKNYYSPYLDLGSFLLLFLTIVYVLSQYSGLPNEIPRRFDITGEPSAWSGKVLIIGLLILYCFLLVQGFLLNYFLFVYPENSRESLQWINIPFLKKETLTDAQVHTVRQYSALMMATINFLISVLFSYILYGTIQTASGEKYGLGLGFTLVIVLILIVPIIFMWKLIRELKK